MRTTLTLLLALAAATLLRAQQPPPEAAPAWKRGAALGLDFAQLLQVNPKQGAGENRIGIGGNFSYFANYKNGRASWDNSLSYQFGVQRLGSGPIPGTVDEPRPFQKSIDELRFNSKYGYALQADSKFYWSADVTLLTQTTPTYAGNTLADASGTGADPIASFFSPAFATFSLGMDYKANDKFSLFYSPVGMKLLIVANDRIADDEAVGGDGIGLGKSVHGNPWTSASDFGNVTWQMGSMLRASYADKYLGDKLLFRSQLTLFSNYLDGPQNVDLDWTNELAYQIFKGLQISLLTNAFYDHDIFVQVTDWDAPGGTNGLGQRLSFTQQLLIKYAVSF